MVETLLIANRGEIACRIIRTARAMGIRTVAVFSETDRGSLHAAMADKAIAIGPAAAAESYLSITRILEAAARSGADAIHPGYGFLSENADFAESVAAAGLTFIGPPASAIRAMGNKAQAKRLMVQAGVPCLPGAEDGDDAALLKAASAIGFPVMVKAAAGGGGRGMRLVDHASGLAAAISAARSEALNAFGSGELILEKAVAAGRHVEMQILADRHDNAVHLFERDCSAQRRHQKVIEEAPSPAVTRKLREAMGEAAVAAARAVGYEGAGTVEFLLEDGNFHFLEMNTRLQVEHPVTEMITGLDLVQLQIEIARGGKLPFSQDDLRPAGHAIEARLYAENPASGFLPSPGRVALFAGPSGLGIRVDTGIASGEAIPPNYDPMIAKVIAHGATREEALQRLVRALGSTAVFGIASNRDFLMALLESAEFAAGETRTSTIATLFGERFAGRPSEAEDAALAGVAVYIARRDAALLKAPPIAGELLGWSSTGSLRSALPLSAGEAVFDVLITDRRGVLDVETGGSSMMRISNVLLAGGRLSGERDGVRFSLPCIAMPDEAWIATPDRIFRFVEPDAKKTDAGAGGMIIAPMHGRIVEVHVKEGEAVGTGARLCMLEAMKMQHAIVSTGPGIVRALAVREDMQVSVGDVLMVIGADDA
jgi:geranyl-CoA carboxylase alpha subunit